MVKRLRAMRETWDQSLSWEDPLETEMATHSSTLAWKIPWTEEPGRLQSIESQREQVNSLTERARWWWGTAPSEIRGESTKQYSRKTPVFFGGGRCSRTSGWTPEARSRICVCRASFLMTFVQSGMPPRLSAHDQCMLSHDISACSAT